MGRLLRLFHTSSPINLSSIRYNAPMQSAHPHPKPRLDRLTQYSATALLIIMALTVPLQILLALLGIPAFLFLLTAIFTALLTPFVLLLTTATPAVEVSDEGVTIMPVIWRRRFVPWSGVTAVKEYPLLPGAEAESGRKLMTGRNRYAAAQGLMLAIPALPAQYRITGFLAGEGFTPVIAVTNRTHVRYDVLVDKIGIYYADTG